MANNTEVKRGVVIYLDGHEVENSAKSIRLEMNKVKKEIDGCTLGSKEYVAATKRYRELNGILQEHKNQLRDVKTTHFDVINTINNLWQKWNVTLGGFMAAFAGVSLALSKFRKEMNADEESAANLKALTGLDDESIAWLEEQARTLSTTMDQSGLRIQKSTKDILEAYMLVGSAKPELLKDKNALNAVTVEALRLAEAAKMDTKPAVDGVTLALNQYGASADEAARYVNVLAAGSKFGAANVESQTASITKAGVAASVAKVPIESLVGSIETLAEKGIKGEVAGTGLKTFFLKLEGMADDVRPSVVGLETALENLRAKNLSTAETQKMFGLEAYTVAQAMISGADKVRDYTSAVTDTNTAIEQAAINSDTANAKLTQMKNEFNEQGKILVKELNPAITKLVSLGMNSTKILVEVVRLMTEHKITLILATAAITAYVAWVNRKIIIDKLAVFWTNQASLAVTSLNRAIMANPWGAAITALTIIVGLVADYKNKAEQATQASKIMDKVNKDASETYADEAGKIDKLNKQIHDNTISIDARRDALKQLKEIVPDYLADLTTEGELINDNKDAIDKYLVSLEKQIKLKAVQDELTEKYKERRLRQKDLEAKQAVEDEKRVANTNAKMAASFANIQANTTNNGYAKVGAAANASVDGVRRTTNELNAAVEARQSSAEKLAETNRDIEALEKEFKESEYIAPETPTTDTTPPTTSDSTTSKDPNVERIKAETAAIELEIKNRRNVLRQEYIDGKKDKQNYNNALVALEVERINRILQIAGLEPEKIAELQSRLQDLAIKAKEDLNGLALPSTANEALDSYKQELSTIESDLTDGIGKLRNALQLGVITQDQFNEQSGVLWDNYNVKSEKALKKYSETIRNAKDETKKELHGLAKAWEDAGLDMEDVVSDIGEALGTALADSVTNNMDGVKNALKSLLNIIIDAIEKMVIAAEVESTLLTLTGLGTAAGVANLAKLVGIKVAFAALKEGVNSFAIGGYTGIGGAYEPAGIVHKGEFVANRHALSNPAVRAVLDLIDNAQKSGTIANLSSSDISAAGQNSYAPQLQASSRSDAELLAVLKATATTLQQVNDRFSKPIKARTYVLGDGGIDEAIERASELQSNAKRIR